MSKYRTENIYYCTICDQKYTKDLDAIDCYDSHHKFERIINFYYRKGAKYPNKIILKFKKNEFDTYGTEQVYLLLNEIQQ
jgi:hypothetical protein